MAQDGERVAREVGAGEPEVTARPVADQHRVLRRYEGARVEEGLAPEHPKLDAQLRGARIDGLLIDRAGEGQGRSGAARLRRGQLGDGRVL